MTKLKWHEELHVACEMQNDIVETAKILFIYHEFQKENFWPEVSHSSFFSLTKHYSFFREYSIPALLEIPDGILLCAYNQGEKMCK